MYNLLLLEILIKYNFSNFCNPFIRYFYDYFERTFLVTFA